MNKFAEYSQTYARTGDDHDCEVYSMKLLVRMNDNRSIRRLDGENIDGRNLVDNNIANGMNNRINNGLDEVEDHFNFATISSTCGFGLVSQTSSETSSDTESIKSCKSSFSVSNTDDELQGIIERFSTVI